MRYYTIVITPNPATGAYFDPIVYTSVGALGDNYSALQLDLDIYQSYFHQPAPLGSLTLYGVSFEELNQSANFVGSFIKVYLGMTPGLPFANASQAGLVVSGTILQSFGNWQGNNVSLSLIITASEIDPTTDINLSFNWEKGQKLEQAVKQTLSIGYNTPIDNIQGGFSQDLIFTEVQTAVFTNINTFASWVNTISKAINPSPNYFGASITCTSSGFLLSDGRELQTEVKMIDFTDLIGNITWLSQATISVKVVMRADLEPGMYIKFPYLAPVVNTATFAQARNQVSFQGVFRISQLRHQGSSRQASADSWVTVIEATIPAEPLYLNFNI